MALRLNIKKTLRSGAQEFELSTAFEAQGRSIVLFGPSGSGKTLTLRAVAGLMAPDAGRIELDGKCLFDAAQGV
ncbi:MAG: ATP-binding cassette domain-containing protein, partial [Humidesulfovibrio sp.]|nr:ATP-binding cassette domain-containing protein [Humidesulfovibrio sp.]